MTESCDIVVIGGGPGGSACATLLADQGYRVTLLERAKFPREHVGESLLPASIPVLEQIGVMPAIESAGFVVKHGATLVWGKDPDPWSWYFADDPGQRPTSFQVVRSEFDHILLRNAAEHGVDVREEHQVLDIEFDADRVSGVKYLHAGEPGSIDCRFLVDASGQAALLSRKLGLHQWDEHFKNLAVYGYYQDAKHLDPPNNGNIFIESYEHGWLWKIPLHTGVTSVGAVVDKEIGQQGLREARTPRIPRSPGRPRAAHQRAAPRSDAGRRSRRRARLVLHIETVRRRRLRACRRRRLLRRSAVLLRRTSRPGQRDTRSQLRQVGARRAKHRNEAAQLYESLYRKQYDYFHLTAQLFYGTNRSADSYFWEARRILGENDSTPREAFVRVVSGQPPTGYERAVIEHGELPPEIELEVRQRDDRAERRRRATEAITAEAGALLRAAPSLPGHVRLEQRRALAGANFQQAFQLVVNSGDRRSEPYPITAVMAACIGQMNGRTPLGEIVTTVNRQHNLRDEQGLRTIIERDLPPLINAGLVDVSTPTAGRNDPCPCGSGKKYKRCHGR